MIINQNKYQMDCCVGTVRINFGDWYCPIGSDPKECTYCEYCINNKCIELSKVVKVPGPIRSTNCDCSHQNNHPKFVSLCCPACNLKRIGCFSMASCGTCNACDTFTSNPEIKYCPSCSVFFGVCEECGYLIKNGNSIVAGFEKVFAEKVASMEKKIADDPSGKYREYYKESIEIYTKELENVKAIYKNKPLYQVLKLIQEHQRKLIKNMDDEVKKDENGRVYL